ncbi:MULTISPECIES: phospho-N-acetylmuramoyl-pentapeptide-transferase [Streptomyces]|uniref:Phospho-N-acetylmuramoyl-pentapeptide-transferase n=2 Tax=Streptomyces phaeochromogenes group TaxID=2838332 RepID=A0ABU0T2E1_9ACTN|nr:MULTISPECIES: phospho-N-acetylmuramoyl-pentapeptide-transferase [Streptomyces]MCR3728043.1 phospho-N-acetylmuramoyl-pentapeptide-transferase [Streptomyces umbrinus]MCX4557291.1 phospho-N-acetylmuramoyl-pentapeptide-transferase [Streptomyces phaeochromogenes]MCX5597451.1 phospho-N-acetylmuramoyl-pentapeptide-transferase [Streptomyces phaeochromogenes]MCZ4510636.1 phospho-N-acetylmuramoyl-pentapeptide-transferase [Streptomyces sp. ActVer]MDQ1029990.1 phospho-N-acetylmuramoyl-pentapeptide-tran
MNQILFAGVIGLFLTLVGTPMLIKLLARKGYGQYIRDDGPREHHAKRGTPTMGGIAFILATLLAYFLSKVITGQPPRFSGVLVLGLMTGMGLVGFLDDYIKIVKRRSLGLRAKAKMAGQLIVGVSFAVLSLQFPDNLNNTPASTKLSFVQDFGWSIGPVLFVVWALFMILAMSNGVNLTDGLDGLATGASVMVFGAYTFIGVWQFQESCANAQTLTNPAACYEVRDPLDLAVVAAALMGACFGFLWWNTSPAKIFMGDTGSLALGGALAGLAICSRTELLVALLGGLFVLITMSVVIQVGSFRLTGKRVFRMAPLQHHFELKGWSEVLVVVRFWIIQGMCVIVGLGLFYAGWAAQK